MPSEDLKDWFVGYIVFSKFWEIIRTQSLRMLADHVNLNARQGRLEGSESRNAMEKKIEVGGE